MSQTKQVRALMLRPQGATAKQIHGAIGPVNFHCLIPRFKAKGYKYSYWTDAGGTRTHKLEPPAHPATSFSSTIFANGQVTLHAEVRDHLGVKLGGKVTFHINGKKVEVKAS